MRRLLPDSLRARMLITFLGPALLFVAALLGLAYVGARAVLRVEVGQRLADSASVIAANVPSGLVSRFSPDMARTHANLLGRLARAAEATGARRVFLATLDGRSLADTAPTAPPPGEPDRALAEDRFELEQVAAGQTASSVLYTSDDGTRFLRGFAPVFHEGRVVAALGVEGSAQSFAALDAWSGYALGLGVVAVGALGLLVWWFGRALSAPLERLSSAAGRIGQGELASPIAVSSGTKELAVLSQAMEEMRVALLQRERELQLMLGGIAHEIRNPLGGMTLFVGLLDEDLAEQPEPRALLKRVQVELATLERIVEEFLEFARRRPVEGSVVSLAALVAEVEALSGLKLICDPLNLFGDPLRLKRLFLNLARNAAQAGAKTLEIQGTSSRLTLKDDGPGISAEAAAQIFDAFFTTREKGTGLGLALCRKIAQEHGGELTLANPGEPGACFVLNLGLSPLNATPPHDQRA